MLWVVTGMDRHNSALSSNTVTRQDTYASGTVRYIGNRLNSELYVEVAGYNVEDRRQFAANKPPKTVEGGVHPGEAHVAVAIVHLDVLRFDVYRGEFGVRCRRL